MHLIKDGNLDYNKLEMGPDPTRAEFCSKRLTRLWPGYFLTQPEEIFTTRREKLKIWHFWGKFSKPKP